MKRYELIIGLLFMLSTVMKIGALVALCHTSPRMHDTMYELHVHQVDETAHEIQTLEIAKKEQTSHQPLG